MNQPVNATAVINHLPAHAARTLAVEILLSDPLWLRDDVLESSLYLLRDRLAEAPGQAPDPGPAAQEEGNHGQPSR
jgi:hypothetical protein